MSDLESAVPDHLVAERTCPRRTPESYEPPFPSTMGPDASLRLYHEVTVASADEQFFEYVGCHERTGLLRTASVRSTL